MRLAARFFTAEYAVPRPAPEDIRFKPELGGGVFLHAAGYLPAAAALQIEAPPASVLCQEIMDATTGVDEAVAMMVEFADGQIGHYRAAYGLQTGLVTRSMEHWAESKWNGLLPSTPMWRGEFCWRQTKE